MAEKGKKAEMASGKKKLDATAVFEENRLIVWDIEDGNKIYSEKYFGKWIEEDKVKYLLLSLEEGMLLLERGFLTVKKNNRRLSVKQYYNQACKIDKEFPQKFTVFRDLRMRGFIVKSGFKFGTHFRVYERGVNPYKEGVKTKKEHTKYNVHAVPENHTMSYQEWSRYVRLSQNIRAKALLAVVDEENGITYYEIRRKKP